jgi:acyl-CoA reductase-like NAD-dependent aldehyde dehydrogenase
MNGVWIGGVGRHGRGDPATLIEPYSGREFLSFAQGDASDLDEAVAVAAHAFQHSGWRRCTPLQRARVLNRGAAELRQAAEELGHMEAQNVGRPLRESTGNVHLAADALEYFASLSTHIRGASIPMGPGILDYTVREPLGVCGLIAPWNNPLVLTTWKVAAALAAGNAVVVKPASLTPLSTLRLAEILSACGLPDGQLNVVTGSGGAVGDQLVQHPGIAKISFTGSTPTGRRILRLASDRLARVTLELGGKSPSIVFADADLELALGGSIPAMFGNAGQMCTARSRVLVHRNVAEEFSERLAEKVAAMKLGSPFAAGVQLGPVISAQQRDTVRGFIIRALDAGASASTGGAQAPDDPALDGGYFVRPTVLVDVSDEMEAVREEIFGPVLVVDTFDDDEEAISRANASPFGLAATIWTRDLARAHRVAGALQSGTVTVNTTKVSHVYAPFGGYKQSGLGRELGTEGLDAFLETKNVIVAVPDA